LTKQVDKLKKAIYKESRKKGKSIAKSMVEAGCPETTAYHDSKNSSLVKLGEAELMAEVKASDISVDWVVSKLNQELVSIHAKSSDRVRILELLGKYLNMFKDNNSLQQINIDISGTLEKLRQPKPIDIEPVDNSKSSSANASSDIPTP
jgi:hypothetical protein